MDWQPLGRPTGKPRFPRVFFVTTAPSAAVDLPTGMPQGDGRSIISSPVAISKGNFSEFLWLDDFTSVHLATETLKSNRINKN